jgi:aminopeptidase-like protein
MPKKLITKKDKNGKSKIRLPKGKYEVFIDAEFKPGLMKVGVHTIKGKSDREILLFAHLDHPYQANDNLSAVACLVDMVNKVKPKQYDHTIKLIFCPETIGSSAYGAKNDLSKVDFVIALDIIGNKTEQGILFQKAFDETNRVNDVAHLALRGMGTGYRQGKFRSAIGSDEYYFNDPQVGIPGILFTTFPYDEYHSSADTPEIIDYEQIAKAQYAVLKVIDYYERDYIPVRKFKGALFRSGYGIQTRGKQLNLSWDYLIYSMDGKKTLSSLCVDFGLNFEHTYELLERLIKAKKISRRTIAG